MASPKHSLANIGRQLLSNGESSFQNNTGAPQKEEQKSNGVRGNTLRRGQSLSNVKGSISKKETAAHNSKMKKASTLKRTTSAPPAMHTDKEGKDLLQKRRKSRSGPKSKSSNFIGVSQYRRTGRWEAHIWDCGSPPGVKGKQLHLGSFDCAEDAARAYDRAAIHFRGEKADTNYHPEQYRHDPVLQALKNLSKDQFVLRLRGVAQHHKLQSQRHKEIQRRAQLPFFKLQRSSSYPAHSPHSVLQTANYTHADDFSLFLEPNMNMFAGAEDAEILDDPNFPAQLDAFDSYKESFVYRGKVLNSRDKFPRGPSQAYQMDRKGQYHPVPSPHAMMRSIAQNKDNEQFIVTDNYDFDGYAEKGRMKGSELHYFMHEAPRRPNMHCAYDLPSPNAVLDKNHMLEKKSLMPEQYEQQETPAVLHMQGTSVGQVQAPYAPKKSEMENADAYQDQDLLWSAFRTNDLTPLMEGMGEVDTGNMD